MRASGSRGPQAELERGGKLTVSQCGAQCCAAVGENKCGATLGFAHPKAMALGLDDKKACAHLEKTDFSHEHWVRYGPNKGLKAGTSVQPSPATHSIWTGLKAGETVYRTGD